MKTRDLLVLSVYTSKRYSPFSSSSQNRQGQFVKFFVGKDVLSDITKTYWELCSNYQLKKVIFSFVNQNPIQRVYITSRQLYKQKPIYVQKTQNRHNYYQEQNKMLKLYVIILQYLLDQYINLFGQKKLGRNGEEGGYPHIFISRLFKMRELRSSPMGASSFH